MHRTKAHIFACAAACAAQALLASQAAAVGFTTVTKSFQQGVSGYAGEFTRLFTSSYGSNSNGNNAGASGTQLFVDGYNGTNSGDAQLFIQFNNIIGSVAGQIPANAFILDASLTLTTGTSGDSQSGGPFGVGAVLVPWSAASTYNTLKPAGSPADGLGADYGVISRATGFYDDPTVLYGGTNTLESAATAGPKGSTVWRYSANVAPLVQRWATGSVPNYGFTVHSGSGTTDGWQVKTGSHGTVADRPLLNVTYTTAPVQTKSFQQGVNGYNGTTMSWVRLEYDITQDGASTDAAFLDGWQYNNDVDNISSDDHALVKFDNLFEGKGGDIPKTARIVKATLVLTTGTGNNAQTGQPFQAHQMLRDWSTDATWSDFDTMYGPNHPSVAGPMLSAQYGMIPGSQAQFDITEAVSNWQLGQPNYGIDVRATPPTNMWGTSDGTNDGWQIYFTGASDPSLRPELLIHYLPRLPGDANEDGVVDVDDYSIIDRGYARQLTGWNNGDFNVDGAVNSADYLIIDGAFASGGSLDPAFLAMREAQFGSDYAAALVAAVPEPASLGLAAVGALGFLTRRRRS